MRLSNLFGRTLREAPADADLTSHALLVRAAMIRPLASGLYAYLPLGWRVVQRIETILREEMATVGAQEMRFVHDVGRHLRQPLLLGCNLLIVLEIEDERDHSRKQQQRECEQRLDRARLLCGRARAGALDRVGLAHGRRGASLSQMNLGA